MIIFNKIKKIIVQICCVPNKKILQIIKQSECDYISFDIFDTLIKRNIASPCDIFWILEDRYKKNYSKDISFHNMRIQAEINARSNSEVEDISIDEIYDSIEKLNNAEKMWLKKEEIKLELLLCQRNSQLGEIYDWCIHNNREIILTSDMYLPKNIMTDILNNAGYYSWKTMYLSGDTGLSKTTGHIFDYIIKNENIGKNALIHIGDTLRGDYFMPLIRGIKSCLIFNDCYDNKQLKSQIDLGIIRAFTKNNCTSDDIYKRIGYRVLGPLLYGYTQWMYNKIKEQNINKLFFLAREGNLLKKSFNILYQNSSVSNMLISVSRKATVVPLLQSANSFDDILKIIYVARTNYTLKELYEFLGLDKAEIDTICIKTSISEHKSIYSLSQKQKEIIFNIARPYIKRRSEEQMKNICGYLDDCNFNGKVAVADIGWHGTIQDALGKILPKSKIYGFYLGKRKAKAEPSFGYLFDINNNTDRLLEVSFSIELMELLFLSVDGTTVSYGFDGKKYFPIKSEPEQIEENTKIILDMQKEALRFVSDFKKSGIADEIQISPAAYYEPYRKMIYPPKLNIIRLFKRFKFLNNGVHVLVAPHSLIYYIFHPITFKNDFMNCGCKIFFLKDVFKIPLPYFKILCFLKKLDKHGGDN